MPKRAQPVGEPRDYAPRGWKAGAFAAWAWDAAPEEDGGYYASVAWAVAMTIRTARQDRQWSQAQLAEMAGLSRNTITNIESGRAWPDFVTLTKIANALEVTIEIRPWSLHTSPVDPDASESD